MILLKIAITLCVYFFSVMTNTAIGCQTPDSQQGVCKPIKDCSVLYSLLNNNLNNQTTLYLRRSRCGGSGGKNNPRVCCPWRAPNFENFASGCYTPQFQEGECKPIKECSILYSLLDSNLTDQKMSYLRNSRCGGGNNKTNPKVCCPSKSPTFKDLTKINCTTPHNQQGQCKPIKECLFLYTLLDNLNNQTRTYLRDSRCDNVGNKANPNVCCPREAPKFEHTTRKPKGPCQTSDGQNGICKARNKCPQSPVFGNNIQKSSRCGNSKVCCPVINSSISMSRNPLLPKKSECGLSTEDKIYGGNRTSFDEFTWMALLQYQSKNGTRWFGCGGALISKRYVLTARHCLLESLKSVRLGEWDLSTNPDCVTNRYGTDCAPKSMDIPIEEQIPYKDKTSFRNDIGLVRLNQEVTFGDFLNPICLPTTPKELGISYNGKKLVVAGWGKTEKKVRSDVKLKVLIPVIPRDQCVAGLREAFRTDEITLEDSQICAGGEKGKDTCNGDSGGPLMYMGARWYLAGIVSFGVNSPCGQEDRPSVFIKVSKYVEWIIDNIKP